MDFFERQEASDQEASDQEASDQEAYDQYKQCGCSQLIHQNLGSPQTFCKTHQIESLQARIKDHQKKIKNLEVDIFRVQYGGTREELEAKLKEKEAEVESLKEKIDNLPTMGS